MSGIYLTCIKKEETTPDKEYLSIVHYPVNSIHYIYGGEGYFNGMHLEKGDGFIVFKGTNTTYYPEKKNPWKYIWIDVEGNNINCESCICDPKTNTFKFVPDEYFFKLTDFITESLPSRITNITFCRGSAHMMLATHILDNHNVASKSISRQHVDNAKEYIAKNFYMPISIENIANNLHISRAYLRNIFNIHEGISPQMFLVQTRLNKAKELLFTTSMSAAQISYAVGYTDPIQFYKAFKKHVGVSALEYRRNANMAAAAKFPDNN